jgi:hypothetical protein
MSMTNIIMLSVVFGYMNDRKILFKHQNLGQA